MLSSSHPVGPALAAALPVLIAALAGAMIPLQAGANAALARTLGHPLWATLVSLLVSLAVVVALMLALRVGPPPAGWTTGPAWIWIGGALGVFYLTAALMLAPRLGASGFIAAVVAGQMLASLWMDHAGLAGFAVRELTAPRLGGAVLIVLGVVAMQWSASARVAGALD